MGASRAVVKEQVKCADTRNNRGRGECERAPWQHLPDKIECDRESDEKGESRAGRRTPREQHVRERSASFELERTNKKSERHEHRKGRINRHRRSELERKLHENADHRKDQ